MFNDYWVTKYPIFISKQNYLFQSKGPRCIMKSIHWTVHVCRPTVQVHVCMYSTCTTADPPYNKNLETIKITSFILGFLLYQGKRQSTCNTKSWDQQNYAVIISGFLLHIGVWRKREIWRAGPANYLVIRFCSKRCITRFHCIHVQLYIHLNSQTTCTKCKV